MDFLAQLLKDPATCIAQWISQGAPVALGFIWLIIFIETGVVVMPFLPGDSLLFAAGVFAHKGALALPVLLLVVWVAAIVGDQCNFFIGHFVGTKIIESGKVKAMTPERIEKAHAFMDKWGGASIFLGRFFPFIRTFVPFLAGTGGMRWHSFVIFNVLGGIVWSSAFVLLGYFFGGLLWVSEHFELLVIGIVAVSLVPAIVTAIKVKLNASKKANG